MTAVKHSVTTGLNVTLLIADGSVILSVAGTVDWVTSPILAARITSAVIPGARNLIIDLRRATSFSSAGTEVLACAQRAVLPTRLAIVADMSSCESLDFREVNRLVPLYSSLDEALAANR